MIFTLLFADLSIFTISFKYPSIFTVKVVNKVLIEFMAMGVLLAFPTHRLFGLGLLIPWPGSVKHQAKQEGAAS